MANSVTAASTVRAARTRAGLSQSELARLSGVPQPHISLIEAGKVEPTEQTLRRLLEATRVKPSVLLKRYRNDVLDLVAQRHGHDVRVFGSVARGEDREDSDIDLLIDFDQGTSIFTVAGLARELAELLGVEVDVVSNGGKDSAALASARSEAVPV